MSRDPVTERVCDVNRREVVRQGPIQPVDVKFPASTSINLRFQSSWFAREERGKVLEYSVSIDAAFCYVCRCFGSLDK